MVKAALESLAPSSSSVGQLDIVAVLEDVLLALKKYALDLLEIRACHDLSVLVFEGLEDAPHLVDFLSASELLGNDLALEPLSEVTMVLVSVPVGLKGDPGVPEGLQECLLLADLGPEELVIVQIDVIDEGSVSV